MEEIVVTRYWMLGVVAMMLAFGICAAIGYAKYRQRERS